MAKKKTKKKQQKKLTKKQKLRKERQTYFIFGVCFVVFGLLGLSKLGFLGHLMANVFRLIVGDTYPVLALASIGYGGLLMVKKNEHKWERKSLLWGSVILYISIIIFAEIRMFKTISSDTPILLHTWKKLAVDFKANQITQSVGGGLTGGLIYSGLYFLVAKIGSMIFAVITGITGIVLMLNVNLQEVSEKIKLRFSSWSEKQAERQKAHQARRAEKQKEKEAAEKNKVRDLTEGEKLANSQKEPSEQEPVQTTLEISNYQDNSQRLTPEVGSEVEEPAADESPLQFEISGDVENLDYQLPTITLLNELPLTDQSKEYKIVEKNVGVLEKTFASFGVEAKVVRASLGPSVTKFEIQPAVGVKVSKIVNLSDDLALALAAKDIRMEAPIPGKSLIGIEVPNQTTSMVSFRDVMEAQEENPTELLEVPLGRSISGEVISADLTKMPHLLIAGSTGSGKSVCINGIIASILMKAKPNEVKLMMIDPKMVELNVYNGVPHLLTPVVTNPRKAAQALHKVVEEMEGRYEKFASFGVRNITGYNELVERHNQETGEKQALLPFVVVIVDELADLMMVASNEVEDAIIRLAQMARAAGIHMILATQRPSVDVITGIIKANVPSRIAFAVSSGIDSRTIIDSHGAEKLLGRGDMLFVPMGENKPIRVQGAFISDGEVENIVDFVRDQQEADYQEHMMPTEEVESNPETESQDELYGDAKALVIEMETASISLLQRRFRIGYNRAARLIDELEANQVVGPSEGSKPRKVLLTQADLDAMETQGDSESGLD
ncbi:DNA translocase FtsK [Vagococcus silagei]|uniref:DNA translocase FtsK n=1 Tax=Vagococcus silagei TaxID=2508885 RepID=A0A4S3B9A7_9ENTE|nr:DNA translocase FtsK [Vagococcus silagei]THB61605.1 DNA translocase FtsK [Vagococcus silagei]